jgi:accessory gene regulator B
LAVSAQASEECNGVKKEMINNLSLKIITQLEKRGQLSGEDKEVVAFGLFFLIFNAYCFVFSVIIGLVSKLVIEAIVFFFAFLIIKKYAGGFHAPKEWICVLLSSIGITVSIIIIRFCLSNQFICITCVPFAFISAMLICVLSPLESENKPLEQNEVKKYRKLSIIRIVVTCIILVALLILNLKRLAYPIMVALMFEAVLIVAGYLQKQRKKLGKSNAVL